MISISMNAIGERQLQIANLMKVRFASAGRMVSISGIWTEASRCETKMEKFGDGMAPLVLTRRNGLFRLKVRLSS